MAAIYCRLSRDDGTDAESNSIGNQRDMLRRYARENNIAVGGEYIDDGISGTTFERESFQRMIEDIEAGKIGTILCKDLSRFGRNNALVAFYTEIFLPDNDVRFIAVNDGIDSDKGDNEIMGFKSIINEYYARDISKKIRSSMRNMAYKGWFIGCHAPYGYRLDPDDKHHLLPDETTAPIVQEMFALAAQGMSCRQIGIGLSERKILSPRAYVAHTTGKYAQHHDTEFPTEWNISTVQNILKNREYCGHIVSQKETTKSFKSQKRVYRPEEEWVIVRDTHEPLIDEHTYELAQSHIRVRKRPNANHADNIFAGLLKCSTCGYGLAYNSPCKGRKTAVYACNLYRQKSRVRSCTSHYISFNALYDIVLGQFLRIAEYVKEHEGDLDAFYSGYLVEGAEINQQVQQRDLEKSRRRGGELNTIIKRLFEQNALGKISDERFAALHGEYEAEHQALREKMELLQIALNREKDTLLNAGHFIRAISLYKDATELTTALLHELIIKIVVHDAEGSGKARTQDVDIHWRYVGLLPEKKCPKSSSL